MCLNQIDFMMKIRTVFLGLTLAISLVACNVFQNDAQQAESTINADDLKQYVSVLASDEFLGRQPFTEGEVRTVNYLKEEFEKMGLEGGFQGRFFQEVPMVEITFSPDKKLKLKAPKGTVELNYMEDFIVSTSHVKESVEVKNSELVFAGYGIVAPEFGWNDYEGLDVKGKTVLVLVNDPGFATQNPELFKGNAMTYYGRWTYKFEEAACQGAAGVWVIHETAAAGYPFAVLTNTAKNKLFVQSEDGNRSNCPMNGWITAEALNRLLKQCGTDYETLKQKALEKDFKAVHLKTKLNITIKNKLRFANSKNVVGMIKGSERPDECIVYTAHWDHFGVGPAMNGDSIYNGAVDNGVPLASLMETAKAFCNLKKKPERSVVFLAITAEETGLLGSDYYARNSDFPTVKTIANLNYELFIPMGKMKDVTIYGMGQSELDEYVKVAAKEQGRYVIQEPFPENGMYYRSDHFSFAKVGIPSLFVKGWTESRQHGVEWAKKQVQDYYSDTYHKPSDNFDPHADYSGNAEDAKLFFKIGYRLTNEMLYPKWYEGSEFKALREGAK